MQYGVLGADCPTSSVPSRLPVSGGAGSGSARSALLENESLADPAAAQPSTQQRTTQLRASCALSHGRLLKSHDSAFVRYARAPRRGAAARRDLAVPYTLPSESEPFACAN